MKYEIKKLKGTDYSSHCRDCGFSEVGETYNTVVNAKKHAVEKNHCVEYYTENGKVTKPIN